MHEILLSPVLWFIGFYLGEIPFALCSNNELDLVIFRVIAPLNFRAGGCVWYWLHALTIHWRVWQCWTLFQPKTHCTIWSHVCVAIAWGKKSLTQIWQCSKRKIIVCVLQHHKSSESALMVCKRCWPLTFTTAGSVHDCEFFIWKHDMKYSCSHCSFCLQTVRLQFTFPEEAAQVHSTLVRCPFVQK